MQTAAQDTYPVTYLHENSEALLQQVKDFQHPVYLTAQRKTEAVLLSAREFDRLRYLAALGSEDEGIRQGDEDIRMGRLRPAHEVLEEIRQQPGIPR